MTSAKQQWGWAGSVSEFLALDEDAWVAALVEHHKRCAGEPAGESNTKAWRDEYEVLQEALHSLVSQRSDATRYSLVFEYELPRERGRRPDVILLIGDVILVLEFKQHSAPRTAYLDQVKAYTRDLSEYHEASHHRRLVPILVLTSCKEDAMNLGGVRVTGPNSLSDVLSESTTDAGPLGSEEFEEWLMSEYAPLPSLIAAARIVFEHEPLPHIRRAESAGIPQALEYLEEVAERARSKGEQHLALVTGVPGAGKTLVGLQFVYQSHFGDADDRPAVFLSGNGPLVKVLQYTLKSRVFVQDVHGFLKTYAASDKLPHEHIWVFDEAQRAFDAEFADFKFGRSGSEPDDFLSLGERLDSWAMMVGLIGEGQSINTGEEAGMPLWDEALEKMNGEWVVHCPGRIADVFKSADVEIADQLDLDIALRSHRAEDVHKWVAQLLDGDLVGAKDTSRSIKAAGFGIYVTREIETARLYARERYLDEIDKRYGLLASAKARNVPYYGFLNTFDLTNRIKLGPWFNDPPGVLESCCSLRETATEFQCQGLELDMPIVGWGDDLWWTGLGWESKPSRTKAPIKDPHQIRVNAYRVLLTRGRDGVVVFVPQEAKLDLTHEALVAAGMDHLELVDL